MLHRCLYNQIALSIRLIKDVQNASKQEAAFNFKPNIQRMRRMPYNSPAPSHTSDRLKKNIPDILMKTNNGNLSKQYNGNSVICRNEYAVSSYEDGYASAMEPMDNDEWNDEYWPTDSKTEEYWPTVQSKRSTYVHTQKENSFGKNLKNASYPYLLQMPPRGPTTETKSLRQSLLNIDSSKGLSVKLEPKAQKNSLVKISENRRVVFPKWGSSTAVSLSNMEFSEKGESFPKVFTVTVEKLLQWPKILTSSKAVFELYGILESFSPGKYPQSKRITLRSEKLMDHLTCSFFEIDRGLPTLEKNKWQRCILLVRCNGLYQCLKIRSATSDELMNLDKMITKSSKSKALLLKSAHV